MTGLRTGTGPLHCGKPLAAEVHQWHSQVNRMLLRAAKTGSLPSGGLEAAAAERPCLQDSTIMYLQ